MTRINCIPVSELTDKHLVAEYRELPRVFGLVERAVARGETPDDARNPSEYTLGKGHVRFFYPRLTWLTNRFTDLVNEMKCRGMKPQFDAIGLLVKYGSIPEEWWGHWVPTQKAMRINRARIAERLAGQTPAGRSSHRPENTPVAPAEPACSS